MSTDLSVPPQSGEDSLGGDSSVPSPVGHAAKVREAGPVSRVVPVGTHVIAVPDSLADQLKDLDTAPVGALVGTRVWLEQRQGKLFLHLGDVESAGLGDEP